MSDSSRLKARDRIGQLVDEGSFVELDKYLERSNAVLGYKDVSVQGEGEMCIRDRSYRLIVIPPFRGGQDWQTAIQTTVRQR